MGRSREEAGQCPGEAKRSGLSSGDSREMDHCFLATGEFQPRKLRLQDSNVFAEPHVPHKRGQRRMFCVLPLKASEVGVMAHNLKPTRAT